MFPSVEIPMSFSAIDELSRKHPKRNLWLNDRIKTPQLQQKKNSWMLAPNFLIDGFGGSVNKVGDYQKHFDYSDMRKTQKNPLNFSALSEWGDSKNDEPVERGYKHTSYSPSK